MLVFRFNCHCPLFNIIQYNIVNYKAPFPKDTNGKVQYKKHKQTNKQTNKKQKLYKDI